jgi:hypothetical protein
MKTGLAIFLWITRPEVGVRFIELLQLRQGKALSQYFLALPAPAAL